MSTAIVNRISPWMIVAVVVVLALFALATALLYQSGMFHAIASVLHSAPLFAGPCGVSFGAC
jgi:hypothetical protein